MPCTFDKEGNLLRFESGGIWFNASHYHEEKGATSRDFPMGSLQSACAEYEHRTGQRGTFAKIEAERAKWMASAARQALIASETRAPYSDKSKKHEGIVRDEPPVGTIAETVASDLEVAEEARCDLGPGLAQNAPEEPKKAPAKKKGKK